MKILVCGANGFLGRHISMALQDAGHEVLHGVRCPGDSSRKVTEVVIDYARNTSPAIWEARLRKIGKIDAVVNAVGILNETQESHFTAIHHDAPVALFQAALNCNIDTVVQISALASVPGSALGSLNANTRQGVLTPFLQSKHDADAMLMTTRLNYLILRPSLVVGINGDSSQLFRAIASLPLIALPGNGSQQLQPVHVDDLCHAIIVWLADRQRQKKVLCAVGPRPLSYRQMLKIYRQHMGLPRPVTLCIPMPLMRGISKITRFLPNSALTPDNLRMLEQGNIADARPFEAHLQRPAIPPLDWFKNIPKHLLANTAIASWSILLFRYVLALVWLITAALSFGLYPVADSLKLLQPLGLNGTPAMATLMAASTLDLGMGIATLLWPGRILWLLQIALIIGYSAIIALFSPEFYLHPFGPILKNLPILALLTYLYAHQRESA